jgi:hypothetical protein
MNPLKQMDVLKVWLFRKRRCAQQDLEQHDIALLSKARLTERGFGKQCNSKESIIDEEVVKQVFDPHSAL